MVMVKVVRYRGPADVRAIGGVQWSVDNDWTVPVEDLIELLPGDLERVFAEHSHDFSVEDSGSEVVDNEENRETQNIDGYLDGD